MKTCILISAALAFTTLKIWACDVCQNNQPKVLKNITHGTGPQGNWDYIIIWSAVVIVAITLFLSIKYLVKPKETAPGHIKNMVIEK